MAIRSLHTLSSHMGVGRSASLGQSLPLTTPLTVIYSIYIDSDTPSEYATFWAFGPESFSGADYFTTATVAGTPASDMSIGFNGVDHVAAQVTTGRWYRQAAVFYRTSVDTFGDFYYDLPDLSKVLHANCDNGAGGANPNYFAATGATTFFRFLDVAWAEAETLDGRGCGAKCFQAVLPGAACAIEAMSAYPVLPQYRPALWGCWPLSNATNLLDISGYGRHLFLAGTSPTTISDVPNLADQLDDPFNNWELMTPSASAVAAALRRNSILNGLGASGPFFHNPLG